MSANDWDDQAEPVKRLEDPSKRPVWTLYSQAKQLQLMADAWSLVAAEFKAIAAWKKKHKRTWGRA